MTTITLNNRRYEVWLDVDGFPIVITPTRSGRFMREAPPAVSVSVLAGLSVAVVR